MWLEGWHFPQFDEGAFASLIGVAIGGVAVFMARWALPSPDLSRVRIPFIGLLVHIALLLTALSLDETTALRRFLLSAAVLLLLLSLGRLLFVVVVDGVVNRRLRKPIPKIFRDILEAIAYSAAVLLTLRQAGAQLDALLTTSALLTAVIGLSLQDTLGNLFAGLSIQAQHPFEVGDWIQYAEDVNTIGRVVEINWRATKVMTRDEHEVVIPNGPLARAPLRNFTKPTPVGRRSLYVVLPHSVTPAYVQRTIAESLRGIPNVLNEPSPSVVTHAFEPRGVQYWIRYYTDDFPSSPTTDGLVYDRIWYALRRAGIDFAVPRAELDVRQQDDEADARMGRQAFDRRLESLRKVDFLAPLSDEELEVLAHRSWERLYTRGEYIIREGDRGDELFIVQFGQVSVQVGPTQSELAELGEGAFFGEMSVMTGAPRTASIRASEDTQLLVVGKVAIKQLLERAPALAEVMTDVLARRQAELDELSVDLVKATDPSGSGERRELLDRIRTFFSLSS